LNEGGGGEKGKFNMDKMKAAPPVPGGPNQPQQGAQGDKRSGWSSIGDISSLLFGAGGVGGKDRKQPKFDNMQGKADPGFDFGSGPPRTEFFLLFIWTEPILGESAPTKEKR
jgi:hypothetical protein